MLVRVGRRTKYTLSRSSAASDGNKRQHLDDITTVGFKPGKGATVIRTVGDTGHAREKPPLLHYAITSPYPKLYDAVAVKGWKRMFYLNPDIWLR